MLWAVYRSGSSAIARAFGQRADTELFFESFTLVHFLGTDRENDRHKDIPADPRYNFEDLWKQISAGAQGARKKVFSQRQLHARHAPIAFVKDFATSFPRWRWDAFPFEHAEHAFLIRHPRES